MPQPEEHARPARLRMAGVHKHFGATAALQGVDLEVQAHEIHALVGENGAGKSTLMRVLAGALLPDAGRMALDGQPYQPRSPADGRRAGVAMIYQELSIAPHLSVAENVLLGNEPVRGPLLRPARMRELAGRALRELGRPGLALDAPAGRLSIGEQQLVEIARAVATGCRVLVLDEPTSSLTPRDVQHLFELLRRLQAAGIAIVYISHVLEEVRAVADRFTVLRDGRSAGGGRVADFRTDAIIALMIGREVDQLYPRSPRRRGEVLLRAAGLSGRVCPRDASLQVHRGEVVGIAGLVGAGRTEFLRAVFGLDEIVRGSIRVAHFSGPSSPPERWAQGVGFLSEDRKQEGLAQNLSVCENLALPRLQSAGPCGLVLPRRQERLARTWIERLRIRCLSARQPVERLSGGNQQKVALARLLHADVDLFLLDEPTRGVDVGSKAQIYRLIDALAVGDPATGRAPRAVLLVSSYLPELLGICDRVAVMCRGRLGEARPVETWSEHAIMLAATGEGARS